MRTRGYVRDPGIMDLGVQRINAGVDCFVSLIGLPPSLFPFFSPSIPISLPLFFILYHSLFFPTLLLSFLSVDYLPGLLSFTPFLLRIYLLGAKFFKHCIRSRAEKDSAKPTWLPFPGAHILLKKIPNNQMILPVYNALKGSIVGGRRMHMRSERVVI